MNPETPSTLPAQLSWKRTGRWAALVFLILLIAGFVAFANALHSPFMIDDHAFFEPKLENPKYLLLHFLPDKNRALHIEGESADPFYRPLATIVPMLMRLAFRDQVAGFHTANLVLFVLAAWGVALFLRMVGASSWAAFLAALFYLVHPINGIAVNYITASVFPVQVIFMLASLFCLWETCRRKNTRTPGAKSVAAAYPLPLISYLLSLLGVLFFLLALMCHETAMMLPFYALLLVWVLAQGEEVSWRWAEFRRAFRKTLPLWIVLIVYFLWRMSHASLESSIIDKIGHYHMNFFEYLATWTMLLVWYLSRLFYPEGIVLIMAHQPLKNAPLVVFWLIVLAALIVAVVRIVRILRKDRLTLLGFLWFVTGFLPFTVACFFQPIHGLMIEPHWFLFPVIGFFVCLARLISRTYPLPGSRSVYRLPGSRVVLSLILIPWLLMTWRHNEVWSDEVRYCRWWLNHSPDFVAVNAYLAKAYELRHDFEASRQAYRPVLKRGYKTYIAYTNMGLMDMVESKWDSARRNLLMAVRDEPFASVAYSNLGAIEFINGHYDRALAYFERCKSLDAYAILPRLNLSKTYLKLNQPGRAAAELEEALTIVPYHEIALVNLIQIYIKQKDDAQTLKVARWILERSQNPNALRNVAIIFRMHGLDDLSRAAAIRAGHFRKVDGND